jgi:hypothetical protein
MRPEEEQFVSGEDEEEEENSRGVTNVDLICLLVALLMVFCIIMWYPRSPAAGDKRPIIVR